MNSKMRMQALRHVDALPDWLSAGTPHPPQPPQSAKELLETTYSNIFESFVEQICRGRPLKQLVEGDARLTSYEDFLRWIKRDPVRHERYKEAQELRTEFMAGEILEIADGIDSLDPTASDTVYRDKLRIETRKYLMGSYNRKRYGESKQIEVATTISITEALAQAQGRLIEGEVIDSTSNDFDSAVNPYERLEREHAQAYPSRDEN